MFKVESTYSMTSYRCFYCWLWAWPQSAYQYSASTFNFGQVFVSSVRKTSITFWKNIKRYIFIVIKVARPISFNHLSLHQIEISYNHMAIFEQQLCCRNPKCIILICYIIAISQRFNFFAVSKRKPILIIETEINW